MAKMLQSEANIVNQGVASYLKCFFYNLYTTLSEIFDIIFSIKL